LVAEVRFFSEGGALVTNVPVWEAVGELRDGMYLREVIEELMCEGFDRTDISVVAGCGVVVRELSAMPDDATNPVGEPDVPRAACFDGLVGAISPRLIDRHHNDDISQQLARGGRILRRRAMRDLQVRDAAPNFTYAMNTALNLG